MLSAALLTALAAGALAAPALEERQFFNTPYAPSRGNCPANYQYIRAAEGLNPKEAAWVAGRKPIATAALKTWLASLDAGFPVLDNDTSYPTLAMVDGGGGFRGFLISAGFHKAFDINEETKYATSGLYQTFTYETGLSGSSLNVATHGWNNWPTVSELQPFWTDALNSGVDKPNGGNVMTTAKISNEVRSKQTSGYEVTLVDTWARDLSYVAFPNNNYGIGNLWSDLPSISGFSTFANPMPIITMLGIENPRDGCGLPPKNATQYEVTPYEFGSWEKEIGNFVDVKYLGTRFTNAKPQFRCTTGFDNVGFLCAISTDTFNQDCGTTRGNVEGFFNPEAFKNIKAVFTNFLGNAINNFYGIVPNPFYRLASAKLVRDSRDLRLVDGGQSIQVPPVWPLIYRTDVDTIIVSDNSADGPSNYKANGSRVNFPSGQHLYNTYVQAVANGVEYRMPYIPPAQDQIAQNINKKPMTFFGCNLPKGSPAMFIIYLPNRAVTFDSNQPAPRLQYDPASTAGMIGNGVAIATNEGDPEFATCIACGLMKKKTAVAGARLPASCNACFAKYCWGYRG